MIAGSPGFMSPEQIRQPNQIDARSDIYSLGCVGYFLLTGNAPFSGGSPIEVMSAQMTNTPEPLKNIRPDLPDDLASVVTDCLTVDRDDRIASAAELADRLANCRDAGKWTRSEAEGWWKEHADSSQGPT